MKRALLFVILAGIGAAAPPPVTLGGVHKVFVESLGSTPEAVMLRDMVISALANSGMISMTENLEHADAILRGSADDQVYTEQHSATDNLSIGLHSGGAESSSSRFDRTTQSKSSALNIGENESMAQNERRHEASASVRLVNRDGDVIWSTTQESVGAKFRSSSADVADKIFRKLAADIQGSRSTASAAKQAGMPTR